MSLLKEIDFPSCGQRPIDDAANGLCGGMSFTDAASSPSSTPPFGRGRARSRHGRLIGSSGVPKRVLAASGPAMMMASDFVAEITAQNPIELDGATILGDLDLTSIDTALDVDLIEP